jgi:hypothetical protein
MWSNRSTSAANTVMAQVPLPHCFWLFHVWCFWWVSAAQDSLKLNWFCLTGKGLPDTRMTQRIQIHILFDNQKIHSVCWRLNTNSWFYLAIGNHAGYLACARCAGSGSLVVMEPVTSLGQSDLPLSAPTTQRCSNCSGTAKVSVYCFVAHYQ